MVAIKIGGAVGPNLVENAGYFAQQAAKTQLAAWIVSGLLHHYFPSASLAKSIISSVWPGLIQSPEERHNPFDGELDEFPLDASGMQILPRQLGKALTKKMPRLAMRC